MQSLTYHTRIGKDGILKVEMPAKFRDSEVDVVLVVNPVTKETKKGWPPGFIERFAGSMPDLPARSAQGDYEVRDQLE
jgi:hypothetical protein